MIPIFKNFLSRKAYIFVVFLLGVGIFSTARAEKLPLKVYTSADGMATSVIHHAMRDAQGFLWFAGRGGVSRFDGYEFTSFRFSETENAPLVHRVLETRDGRYLWILSDNAVYRVERREQETAQPRPAQRLSGVRNLNAKLVSKRAFWAIHETPGGDLLFGSTGGLFVLENKDADEVTFREIEFNPAARAERRHTVRNFADGGDGSLWIATDGGIVRKLPDGRFLTYQIPRVISLGDEASMIRIDRENRIWATFRSGVFVLAPEPLEALAGLPDFTARQLPIEEIKPGAVGKFRLPEKAGEMMRIDFNEKNVRAGQAINAAVEDLFQSSDGKIWIPTLNGLYIFNGNSYRRLRDATALPGISRSIIEDFQGNIWFGTFSGVIKYTNGGLTTYDQMSGLPDANVYSIRETPDGRLLVSHGTWRVSLLDPEGFSTFQLNLRENARFSWTSFPVVPDPTGALWALQTGGLYRFPFRETFDEQVAQTPENVFDAQPEFKERLFYRAFTDKRGDLWFSVNAFDAAQRKLLKFSPATGEWTDLSGAEGYPKNRVFASFAEDFEGNLWFGFYGSDGLVKFAGGRFTEYTAQDGVPEGAILDLLVDRKGRLWLASNEKGLTRIDNPAAEKLEFVRYTENEGLTSDNVRCLTDDAEGSIYAGTVRGVTQINADSGRIRKITTADGLAADFVQTAFRDRHGALWFGTSNGLSKYEPAEKKSPSSPPILIGDLQIAGVEYSISEFGQKSVGKISVSAAENNLQINFFSVGEGESMLYQFKLEGAENSDWNQPTAQRSVNFANLPPGEYRFLVRAVNAAGATSERPAVVALTIRPPFWKTRWFLFLATVAVSLILFSIYRYRTESLRRVNAALTEAKRAEEELSRSRQERLKELEKVRTRIATDLHDDIGSSLTQIAVLSEVARNQAAEFQSETLSMPLERIKGVSRELVETMSDVVWAINPQKDNLRDLVQRMRRFASDICSGRRIHFELNAPPIETGLRLGANIRREVFAIFKEAVNNAVKYSEAARIIADFRIENEALILQISDDGRGFLLMDEGEGMRDEAKDEQDFSSPHPSSIIHHLGGNGLVNMQRRATDLGGDCRIISFPGGGTTVLLEAPLHAPENNFAPPAPMGGDNSNGSHL